MLFIAFVAVLFLVASSPKTTEIIQVTETTKETADSTDGDMPKTDIDEENIVFLNKCTGYHKSDFVNHSVNTLAIDNYSKEQSRQVDVSLF